MKKILLLLAASLVLFACKKDGPQEVEQVADDIDDVTYKVICPKCNAMYFVTCKDPEGDWGGTFSVRRSLGLDFHFYPPRPLGSEE